MIPVLVGHAHLKIQMVKFRSDVPIMRGLMPMLFLNGCRLMVSSKIVDRAVSAAKNTSFHRYRHGCVIFKGDRIISTGHNKKIASTRVARFGYRNCWLHAEADAILKANTRDLRGASLLVVRIGKTKLCNSRPCRHCMALIEEIGIKNVYYSTKRGDIKMM